MGERRCRLLDCHGGREARSIVGGVFGIPCHDEEKHPQGTRGRWKRTFGRGLVVLRRAGETRSTKQYAMTLKSTESSKESFR